MPVSRRTRAESIGSDAPADQAGEGGANPTSALQLRLEEISIEGAQHINKVLHSVLPETHTGNLKGCKRNVAYVATYEGIAYAVAIWTQPIAANRLTDGFNALELRRFAISSYAPKNTASRLLAVMVRLLRKKWPEVYRFISYQSVDHHEGTIYKAAGWEATAVSNAMDWSREGDESRAPMQTTSDKVRWEKQFPLAPAAPPSVRRLRG